MRIVHLTPPGRFPTVTHDVGLWWDKLAADPRHSLTRWSANHAWWSHIFSRRMVSDLLAPNALPSRWRIGLEWMAQGRSAASRCKAALQGLDRLAQSNTFESLDAYMAALAPLVDYLDWINPQLPGFRATIGSGPFACALNYSESRDIAAFAASPGLLGTTIERALHGFPRDADIVTIGVTTPEDLLSSLIVCGVLKKRSPRVRLCLVDHGYENFSLHAAMRSLELNHAFDRFFDHFIVSRDERDELVPALVRAIETGLEIPRFLTLDKMPPAAIQAPSARVAAGPMTVPTFSPAPVMWMRLSSRRCYWSRCTYCTQNSKYADPTAPTRSDVLAALDRVADLIAQGVENFIFSDEALSPSTLRLLAKEIANRKLSFRWACRCKIERAHTADLFSALGQAGCYEILFGIETVSPRILKLMDKYVEGIDEAHLSAVFLQMDQAGIGAHINLIAGYPGETLPEAERSVQFLVDSLANRRGATFLLNNFSLMAETPMSREPHKFGIARIDQSGDLAQDFSYDLEPALSTVTSDVLKNADRLRHQLVEGLGWSDFSATPAGQAALSLYFGSGHGAIFKVLAENPFDSVTQGRLTGAI